MYIKTKCKIGSLPVVLVVRDPTKIDLSKTCFRGRVENLAGNFSRWGNCYELFGDDESKWLVDRLLTDVIDTRDLGTKSVCMEANEFIGWSSTDELSNYRLEDMEFFHPNRKSWAFRVKLDRKDLTAPKTKLLTIVYELRYEERQFAAVVHSIYPGKDIGELRGDVTGREQCVFFDWNHPGSLKNI